VEKFFRNVLTSQKGCANPSVGTDPLGFDYVVLDYICYFGLIFISERSSSKNTNKKKYPENKFSKKYIIERINEEYDLLNLNKYIPVNVFTLSMHELRGLNSKISGHIDTLLNFSTEDDWESQFDKADNSLKKIYVGTRLIKFILDNIRFFNPQNIQNLEIDKSFRFTAHRSLFKIVKIYENDFHENKAVIEFSGRSFKYIAGEKEYFEILIKAIIENALKFSTDKRIGPKIKISDNKEKLIIEISSYGQLVPKEERADIFTRGYRSKIHETTKGTGMGLYIARKLSEQLNFNLEYQAEEVTKDLPIKLGWNKFILTCNETYSSAR
jgi:signal transduction histidine kinase